MSSPPREKYEGTKAVGVKGKGRKHKAPHSEKWETSESKICELGQKGRQKKKQIRKKKKKKR